MLENDTGWAGQTFYFKAGVFPQDNEGDETEGARVSFSALSVSHIAVVKSGEAKKNDRPRPFWNVVG